MKIAGFRLGGALHLGLVEDSEVIDLQAIDPRIPGDLGEWLGANDGSFAPLALLAAKATAAARHPLDSISFALPVARPGKIICLGLNYVDHIAEGPYASQRADHPTIFMRGLTSLAPHGSALLRPAVSECLDYEAELAVIIGKRAKHLTPANALGCVAGYSCFNDGSVRDFQRRTSQWDMGKNFDRTGGFGPWCVSADELPAGAVGLNIQTRLNGQTMQSNNTRNMMFPLVETLVDISQGMTLEPGDVLVMGTPSGVGHARKPPVWMKAGDVCEIDIEGVGVLRNTIENER
jgi:2-keto-4-pentenoate hydratase/2-oxohepta-3-ene-1,7-dioic acid hydratase in catechol pathway